MAKRPESPRRKRRTGSSGTPRQRTLEIYSRLEAFDPDGTIDSIIVDAPAYYDETNQVVCLPVENDGSHDGAVHIGGAFPFHRNAEADDLHHGDGETSHHIERAFIPASFRHAGGRHPGIRKNDAVPEKANEEKHN